MGAEDSPAVEHASIEAVGMQAALRLHQRALPSVRARRRAPARGSRKRQGPKQMAWQRSPQVGGSEGRIVSANKHVSGD